MNGAPVTLEAIATAVDYQGANLRRVSARVAQLEDAVDIYGPPPRRRRLPIPEITPAQREFLIWLGVFATLSVITATRKANHA